jgi:L-alanine-DL-glutamate epimerase-like enolase superfamily enzyme
MHITSIDAIPVRIPLKPERRMISALGKHDVSDFALVRVETDDGHIGVGEATATPNWSGETVWGVQAIVERVFAPVLTGVDPHDIPEISRRMDAVAFHNWFAKSAIEMACWDIIGRAAGKPVYDLLGGACRSLTVPNRFSIGAYPPEVAATRAVERVSVGFTTIKVKVGTDPVVDVARVKAVRAAIGPDLQLMIDANGGWDYPTARKCLGELVDCNLSLVEQPLPRGNYTELAALKRETGCKVLADESCFDEVEARELLTHGCCDAISLYPGKKRRHRQGAQDRRPRSRTRCPLFDRLESRMGCGSRRDAALHSFDAQHASRALSGRLSRSVLSRSLDRSGSAGHQWPQHHADRRSGTGNQHRLAPSRQLADARLNAIELWHLGECRASALPKRTAKPTNR